ncbi:hypothetical protein DBY21_05510 [Candidatus Gastranaerophilales bacterium]|nr:MAG: hypothetical protein DBY21_05510 [Candidatus Gastranaerophilales bacterium]
MFNNSAAASDVKVAIVDKDGVVDLTGKCKSGAAATIELSANTPLSITNTTAGDSTGGGVTGMQNATISGSTVTVTASNDADISSFKVTPSDKTKSWKLVPDDDISANVSGTGEKSFPVKLKANGSGCMYAEYSDQSAKSNEICFQTNGSGGAGKCTLNWSPKCSGSGYNRTATIQGTLSCTGVSQVSTAPVKVSASADGDSSTGAISVTNNGTFNIGPGKTDQMNNQSLNIPVSLRPTNPDISSYTVSLSESADWLTIIPASGTCDGGSTQCVSATNSTTVSLDKSPTASNAITIWPSVYLSKALDKYVEFELACDFKNLDNGNTETYYATVGIDAGRTSPSSTGAAMRGKAGTCYEQLTPCTVNKIKPSTANICKPISETTSKAQTPSGCSSSSTCSITLVGSGDTSSDTSASVNLTGGSTLSTKLDYGNNFRTSWTNLKCGVAYNIKASDCKAGSNTCTVEASPSTISKLTGTQTVTVSFKKAASSKTYNITMCWKDEAGIALKYGNTDATATYCGAYGTYSNPDGSSGSFTDNPANCQKATVKEGGTISWSQNSSCTGAPEGGFSTCVPKGFRIEGKSFSGSTTVQGYSYTNLSGNVLWDCSGSSKPKPTYTISVWPRDEATTDSSNPLFVPCAAANVSNGPLEREVCFQIVGTLTCDSGSGSETKSGMKICFKEGFNSCSSSSGGSGSIGFSNVCAGKKTVSFSYKMVE